MSIFIVFGERGEYSSWHLWPVAAFSTKALAETLVSKLRSALARDLAQWPEDFDYETDEKRIAFYGAESTALGLDDAFHIKREGDFISSYFRETKFSVQEMPLDL